MKNQKNVTFEKGDAVSCPDNKVANIIQVFNKGKYALVRVKDNGQKRQYETDRLQMIQRARNG